MMKNTATHKKQIAILLAAVFAAGALTACGAPAKESGPGAAGGISAMEEEGASDAAGAAEKESNADDGIRVVTTIFPEYDWIREILGENPGNAELTLLLDDGVDLHSFQPTAADIMKIADCDVFVYVGGESDQWVDDALKEAVNPDMVVIDLLDAIGDKAREEELVEGMESDDADDAEEGPEYDEHVWLSLANAEQFTEVIAEGLEKADAEHAAVYEANAKAYQDELNTLDASYQKAAEEASVKTLVFGDRFPFRYLADDYGLSYFAAFTGCSAETEASFETIVFLADKVDELGTGPILTIEGDNHKIAETINENTDSKDHPILIMDSLQGTTLKDAQEGKTYLSAMTDNLEVLKKALQ